MNPVVGAYCFVSSRGERLEMNPRWIGRFSGEVLWEVTSAIYGGRRQVPVGTLNALRKYHGYGRCPIGEKWWLLDRWAGGNDAI